jgi:hypothetical protein
MPKVPYYYAIPVTCIGYLLGYDVFGILISSIIVFWIWNFWVDVPEDFGYVRKEEFLKLKAENEANKKQLHEFATYILKMNEKTKSKKYEWSSTTEDYVSNLKRKTNSNIWRSVLNVGLNATKADVDAAYKSLVKKYHPDINKDVAAKYKMQEVNEAKDMADKYFAGV